MDCDKSYWTKRRKVLSNVDSFLRSYSPSTSTVANDSVLQLCNSSVGDSFTTSTVVSTCSTTDDGTCRNIQHYQQADNVEYCGTSDTDNDGISDDASDWSAHDDDAFADETKLRYELVKWYTRFGISLDALGALLQLLHEYHPILPVDARTLLKTPDSGNVKVKQIQDGNYCHFGVANGIQNTFQQGYFNDNYESKEISLQVNIDGLPLFKSTNYQLWPILGMVMNLSVKQPFTIGVYGGNHKPSDLSTIS